MIEGLVSTIVPVFNRPNLIIEAVSSVLAQTYRPIEIIIVNDGSTDDTGQIIDDLARNSPNIVKVVHQLNAGPGLAREAGRQLARGEFIQYLDSDDILLPNKFKTQVAGLKNNPNCGVSYGKTKFYRYGETHPDKAWKRTGEKIESMFPVFLQSRWWGTSSPLYKRLVTDKAGPWLDLCNEEDWEYDCRIASQGVKLYYCNEFISEEREHSGIRVSHNGTVNKVKLRDRAIAHSFIYYHARSAGINHSIYEMQHFARELFLLSRQCGAAGLSRKSRSLFLLSRAASGQVRGNGWDFRLYYLFSRIFGWRTIGRLSCVMERLR